MTMIMIKIKLLYFGSVIFDMFGLNIPYFFKMRDDIFSGARNFLPNPVIVFAILHLLTSFRTFVTMVKAHRRLKQTNFGIKG